MEPERIQFDFAKVNGIKLHYAIAGSGKKLVILLHGFPEFWYSWRHQIPVLAEKYTVVAPDMRGYNLSDRPTKKSDYTVDNLVGDVVGLIQHFGREKAAVIGHDWGAGVAWAVAMRHPEMLWKLGALQVPPVPIWRRNQTLRQTLASWYMFFFQLPLLPEMLFRVGNYGFMAWQLKRSTVKPGVFTDKEIARYINTWKQPGAPTAMINYYRANFARRFIAKPVMPKKINVPTLFIYGEKDLAVMPATVKGVGDIIAAEYREHRIPNSGHWVQQEAADEVTNVIRDFLASPTA